ncbi:MAG TPA: PAS domain S-box protein [Vicinamibacterales bacterium]|nr:PAS domain S-box protein [Vicinamibacterales bacterium]
MAEHDRSNDEARSRSTIRSAADPITDRVSLEARLRASEARWRAVVESAVDGIVVIDSRGCIESFNAAAQRLFGYTEAEVIGRNVSILMPAPYHDEHDSYISRYLASGIPRIIGIGREITAKRRDGTTFPVHLSVGEMSVDGERKFTGILHDLSGRITMEERLREQTALARLGEMAAVIAHEVKNPLAGVRGAIQVIGGRLPKDSKDGAIVKDILARLDALNDLMKDLLLFARPAQPRLSPVDLDNLVRTTAALLATDPAFKQVSIEFSGDGAVVMADAEQLKIVVQNLLLNAAQAMSGRGIIRVTTGATGHSCRITIHDGGPGVPAHVRDSVFTPFFTTKARGTGLGLPTAKRILEAHGGSIDLTCPPEGGTTVRLTLPAARAT